MYVSFALHETERVAFNLSSSRTASKSMMLHFSHKSFAMIVFRSCSAYNMLGLDASFGERVSHCWGHDEDQKADRYHEYRKARRLERICFTSRRHRHVEICCLVMGHRIFERVKTPARSRVNVFCMCCTRRERGLVPSSKLQRSTHPTTFFAMRRNVSWLALEFSPGTGVLFSHVESPSSNPHLDGLRLWPYKHHTNALVKFHAETLSGNAGSAFDESLFIT